MEPNASARHLHADLRHRRLSANHEQARGSATKIRDDVMGSAAVALMALMLGLASGCGPSGGSSGTGGTGGAAGTKMCGYIPQSQMSEVQQCLPASAPGDDTTVDTETCGHLGGMWGACTAWPVACMCEIEPCPG